MRRDDAIADLVFLERALDERFAYLRANAVDHRLLFADLRARLQDEVEPGWFGLEIQKMLAHFIDGHAIVNAPPSPTGFLPFVTGWVGEALVAFEADRSGLVDPERPFLAAIDGVPVEKWLTAAAAYVPRGSRQFVRREALRWLRAVEMLRRDLGLREGPEVEVDVTAEGGAAPRALTVAVAKRVPTFGSWPRTASRILEGNVGYLRLARMTPEAADDVRQGLERFEATTGLIVDVRGNGGGGRDALLALLPALLEPDDAPRVVNLAAYRSWEGFAKDHLAPRHLHPVASERWSGRERQALEAFMFEFEPEWRPPAEEFSAWHAMVVSPAGTGSLRYHDRPVVVLMDAGSFSATDVFLSGLKGVPGVVLVGEASSGGSAHAQVVELPMSGLKARFASMASFQASGQLFDGRGVRPDVEVRPEPEFFVTGGRDAVLEHALALIREGGSGSLSPCSGA